MITAPDFDRPTSRYLLNVLLISLAATGLVGLFDSGQFYVFQELGGKSVTWQKLAINYLPFWWTAALLMPAVAWFARRLAFPAGRRIRITMIHIVTAIVYAHIHIGATQLAYLAIQGKLPQGAVFVQSVAKRLTRVVELELMIYAIAVAAVLLVEANRSYRENERASAQLAVEKANLQASLADARLDALRMQLQPHFLFNALHAISTLIMRGDNQGAHRMLLALSDFLRMTLDNSNSQVVPLDVELEFLEAYLQIQRERFGDRLQVSLEIDAEARTAVLPALVLQPLVENSIRHGAGKVDGVGTININATVSAGRLIIEVADNGPGLTTELPTEGVGLGNIRARLQQLYPDDHAFQLADGPRCGTVATLSLPWRNQDETADTNPGTES
ncbi:MAG: histidine kinase [Gemmatimonadales bacterium]|nr:histidine kinase [Gemmatimonadales bacterium]